MPPLSLSPAGQATPRGHEAMLVEKVLELLHRSQAGAPAKRLEARVPDRVSNKLNRIKHLLR